jgi:hypothetical protein
LRNFYPYRQWRDSALRELELVVVVARSDVYVIVPNILAPSWFIVLAYCDAIARQRALEADAECLRDLEQVSTQRFRKNIETFIVLLRKKHQAPEVAWFLVQSNRSDANIVLPDLRSAVLASRHDVAERAAIDRWCV